MQAELGWHSLQARSTLFLATINEARATVNEAKAGIDLLQRMFVQELLPALGELGEEFTKCENSVQSKEKLLESSRIEWEMERLQLEKQMEKVRVDWIAEKADLLSSNKALENEKERLQKEILQAREEITLEKEQQRQDNAVKMLKIQQDYDEEREGLSKALGKEKNKHAATVRAKNELKRENVNLTNEYRFKLEQAVLGARSGSGKRDGINLSDSIVKKVRASPEGTWFTKVEEPLVYKLEQAICSDMLTCGPHELSEHEVMKVTSGGSGKVLNQAAKGVGVTTETCGKVHEQDAEEVSSSLATLKHGNDQHRLTELDGRTLRSEEVGHVHQVVGTSFSLNRQKEGAWKCVRTTLPPGKCRPFHEAEVDDFLSTPREKAMSAIFVRDRLSVQLVLPHEAAAHSVQPPSPGTAALPWRLDNSETELPVSPDVEEARGSVPGENGDDNEGPKDVGASNEPEPRGEGAGRGRTLKAPQRKSSKAPPIKYNEVIRKKADRENLKGVECRTCKEFYDAVLNEDAAGIMIPRCELHQVASRHRYRHPPPATPEGFWNIGFDSDL